MKNIRQVARGLGVGGAALALVAGGALLAGGAAVAAGTITSGDIADQTIQSRDIGPGGVGSSEIRDNAIRQHDIGEAAVGSSEIRDGRILMQDFAPDTVEQLKGEKGDTGEAGPAGEQGPAGADGADGVSNYEIVGRSADAKDVTDAEGRVTITSKCSSGDEVAIGGGANTTGTVVLNASMPGDVHQVSEPTETDPAGRWAAGGWTVVVSGTGNVQPYIICATME
ncbi:hypothetical protein ABN028_04355 [Actinopolymorpha sp. B17G11]|uniref:hypothetical protein n=1 Tax=Actinopolymorpha sp. B17G11 TaxID=3160861 RepID=UPI0032E498E8